MVRVDDLQGIYDAVYTGDIRRPQHRVLLYDQTDTFSDIVLSRTTQVPLDITEQVTACSINESEGAATTATLTVVPDDSAADPLTPYHFVGRRIVQIQYRDAAIAEDWIPLFTGPCVGQPGYRRNRENNEKVIQIACTDRGYYYNKRRVHTPEYAQSTDLGDVAVDVATDGVYGMDLEREEVKFGLFRHVVAHTKIALYDLSYMEALEFLGFIVDRAPIFDGGGFLLMADTAIDKPPVRKYRDEAIFHVLEWPQSRVNLNNCVEIIGLSADITKVVSPAQELATIRGTVGYFEDGYKTRVYYTQDRQGRAQNIYISDYNINGQLGGVISTSPSIEDISDFSCVLVVDTPYQPWVFIVWLKVYTDLIALSAIIGDFYSGAFAIAAAIWLAAGLYVMQQMGTFEVTISGEPYKLVYKEIKGRACWDNLYDYEIRTKKIENHLIDNQALADSLAFRELKREAVKGSPRNITLPHDPFLRKHDVIELPDGTRYYIHSISRTYKRGEVQNMSVSAYMVRSGPEYDDAPGFSEY